MGNIAFLINKILQILHDLLLDLSHNKHGSVPLKEGSTDRLGQFSQNVAIYNSAGKSC